MGVHGKPPTSNSPHHAVLISYLLLKINVGSSLAGR
jgi:hypothetical protein